MRSDFVIAITQLAAEKNLPKEVVLEAVEAALVSAFKKDSSFSNQDISVKVNPQSGEVRVYAQKVVAEKAADTHNEIALGEARKLQEDVQVGETVWMESTPRNAGRIAAQTAKHVVLQRLREAEHSAVFAEYAGREGDIISGVVNRIEPKQIIIDLGRTEAVLPAAEQVHGEHYRTGHRIKVYVTEVLRTARGPQVVVSRSHPNLLPRLFELEVPEIHQGIVELKATAREAGYRSKVAVAARQEGVDPVGCCVGLRGVRIQNIVGELNGEKIDVVRWSPDPATFIADALSPASALSVELDAGENAATVVVPDHQLSLAIGREGQNVRLAAKLTGWRIDIKSASMAKAEAVSEVVSGEIPATEEAVEGPILAPEALTGTVASVGGSGLLETSIEERGDEPTQTQVIEEVEPVEVTEFIPPLSEPSPTGGQIRFAEDVLVTPSRKRVAKGKEVKKRDSSEHRKEKPEEGIKPAKKRRLKPTLLDEDELDEL
jgi:N utilization substance protein A